MTFLPRFLTASPARAAVALALFAAGSAMAANVKPAGVTASSSYPDENGASYNPEKATDGKLSTSWVEGDQGSGLGSWIEVDLGGAKTVRAIKVWGGLQSSGDYWSRANRPHDLEILFSDGSKQTVTMTDKMVGQELQLPTPKSTTSVRVKIKSIYDGSTWLDTAISEIQVIDDAAPDRAGIRSATASTTLASDADGSYEPANAFDGISDTIWCEGNKTGGGDGDWLQFTFDGSQTISSMTLINGIATPSMWMKANRAGTATLQFSDGSTAQVTLKNVMTAQTVTFPAKTTSSVKVTFGGIVAGKEYNDLCISEAYFPL